MQKNVDLAPRLPDRCPSCFGALTVTRLACADCGVEVSGHFRTGALDAFAPEDMAFVLLFVRRKGNLREMERDLGISYWTLRRTLDDVVTRLEAAADGAPQGEVEHFQDQVLRRLRDGEISAAQALQLLRQAGRAGSTEDVRGGRTQ